MGLSLISKLLLLYFHISLLQCQQKDTGTNEQQCFHGGHVSLDTNKPDLCNDNHMHKTMKSVDETSKTATLNITGDTKDDHALRIEYELSTYSGIDAILNTCAEFHECKYDGSICHCDEVCGLYGDCCFNWEANITADDSSYVPYMSCVKIVKQNPPSTGFMMVSKCPVNFTDASLAKKCEYVDFRDEMTFIPVGYLENSIIFQNKYCAKCHGFENVEYWDAFITGCGLEKFKTISNKPWFLWDVLYSRNCDYLVGSPFYEKSRLCSIMRDSKCAPGQSITPRYNTLRNTCFSHTNPVWIKGVLYRNIHCYLCENGIDLANSLSAVCRSDKPFDGEVNENIFGITMEKTPTEERNNDFNCQRGNIYVSFLNKCIKHQCPKNKWSNNGICEDYNLTVYNNEQIETSVCLQASGDYTKMAIDDALTTTVRQMFRKSIIRSTKIVSGSRITCNMDNVTTDIYCVKVYLQFIFKVFSADVFYQQLNPKRRVRVIVPAYKSTDIVEYTLVTKDAFRACTNSVYNYNDRLTFLCSNNLMNFLENERYQKSILDDYVIYCVIPGIFDRILAENLTNSKEENLYAPDSLMSKIQKYLLFTCHSIVTGILIACISIKRKSFQTMPKKIFFNLLLIHLLSNCLFLLTAIHNGIVCFISSVFQHFLFLSFYLWISMYSFHVYYIFVVSIRFPGIAISMNPLSIRKLLRCYAFVGYLVPFLIALTTIVLDMSYGHTLGYNGNEYCFLTNKEAVIFSFVTPVVVTYILNTFCLLSSVAFVKNMTSKLDIYKAAYRENLGILVTLVTLAGTTACLCLYAILHSNDVLWVIFLFSHVIQGIGMACICHFSVPNTSGRETVSTRI